MFRCKPLGGATRATQPTGSQYTQHFSSHNKYANFLRLTHLSYMTSIADLLFERPEAAKRWGRPKHAPIPRKASEKEFARSRREVCFGSPGEMRTSTQV